MVIVLVERIYRAAFRGQASGACQDVRDVVVVRDSRCALWRLGVSENWLVEFWMTIVGTAGGILGGGAVGAYITTRTQLAQAQRARRHLAASALWAYQRALMGFGNRMWDRAHGDVDAASVSVADFGELRTALAEAYPYAGYLPPDRHALVRNVHLDFGGAPGGSRDADASVADAAFKIGRELEAVLLVVFRGDDR